MKKKEKSREQREAIKFNDKIILLHNFDLNCDEMLLVLDHFI
jgi:hypothetical protein